MGKKSFALVKEIMKKKLGRYPTRAELFEECYYRADGSSTSAVIQEAIEQMKQLGEQEHQSSNDKDCTPTSDDAFAKIMGIDKNGHVCMYGMGVTRADIYGTIPSRDASYRLAMEYKEKYDALNEKLESLSAIVRGRPSVVGQTDAQNIPLASSNNRQSSASTTLSRRIRVHSYVVLKSFVDINEIIAKGYVSEMDSVRVNGEELGYGWCEIIIQSQIKKDVRLLKPYDHIQTIGDSLGAPVAWPLSLVALDENDD